MINMTSTEAKTHFGALLDMAQINSVTIQKKGRPVAVILSESEYKAYQQLKLQEILPFSLINSLSRLSPL